MMTTTAKKIAPPHFHRRKLEISLIYRNMPTIYAFRQSYFITAHPWVEITKHERKENINSI